jgi:tryptophan halogenase
MVGQGILPRAWHPLVDNVPDEELSRFIDSVGRTISNCVDAMPPHQAFIDRCCKASVPVAA